jgi:hypothetical protein
MDRFKHRNILLSRQIFLSAAPEVAAINPFQIAHEVSNWLGIARREPGLRVQDNHSQTLPRSVLLKTANQCRGFLGPTTGNLELILVCAARRRWCSVHPLIAPGRLRRESVPMQPCPTDDENQENIM